MAKYKNYVMVKTIEEAYELNQKKSSVVVAGNMWLRMCGLNKQTAIDLSGLGLDRIEETEVGFIIGAMTTLRALETSAALDMAFAGAFKKALSPIVGTQFRNGATIGGSVYSRFGFSDVSALLLVLDAEVVLYKRGAVKLADYQKEAWDRDIITHIRIQKGQKAAIHSVRVSETDIPVLVCAASKRESGVRIVLGARPARAVIAADGLDANADAAVYEEIAAKTAFGTNLRASEAYRRKIAPVLMERCVKDCGEV